MGVADRYNKKVENKTTFSKSNGTSVKDRYAKKQVVESVNKKSQLAEQLNMYQNMSQKFASDNANNLTSDYYNKYQSGAGQLATDANLHSQALNTLGNSLKNNIDFYNLGDADKASLKSGLDSVIENNSNVATSMKNNSNYFNQFKDENEFNTFQTYKDMDYGSVMNTLSDLTTRKDNTLDNNGKKSYQDKIDWINEYYKSDILKNENLDELASNVQNLEDTIQANGYSRNHAEELRNRIDTDDGVMIHNQLKADEEDKLLDQYDAAMERYNQAEAYQNQLSWSNLSDNGDYEEQSQKKLGTDFMTDIDISRYGYQFNEMNDEELKNYKYLYNTQGKYKAEAYRDSLDLGQRLSSKVQNTSAQFADKHPILGSIASVAEAPLSGAAYVSNAVSKSIYGNYDPDSPVNQFSRSSSSARGQVSSEIDNKFLRFLYNTGMSVADNVANIALTSGMGAAAEPVALAFMSTQAAQNATLDALDKGLSQDDAFLLGTINGAAEAITEKVSLGRYFSDTYVKSDVVSKLKHILENQIVEGSEEVGSDIIDGVADVLISRDKSDWQTSIQAYMDQGMSEKEASLQAFKDASLQTAMDFGGGFISGGVMSGAFMASNDFQYGRLGKKINNLNEEQKTATIKELLNYNNFNLTDDSIALNEKIQNAINNGNNISDSDLGQLYANAMQGIQDANQETFKNALLDQGIDINTANKITNAAINGNDSKILAEYTPQINVALIDVYSSDSNKAAKALNQAFSDANQTSQNGETETLNTSENTSSNSENNASNEDNTEGTLRADLPLDEAIKKSTVNDSDVEIKAIKDINTKELIAEDNSTVKLSDVKASPILDIALSNARVNGYSTNTANAVLSYSQNVNTSNELSGFYSAFNNVYNMAKDGVSLAKAKNMANESAQNMQNSLFEMAYDLGTKDRQHSKEAINSNPTNVVSKVTKRGTVRNLTQSEANKAGVKTVKTMSGLSDKQKSAVYVLRKIANSTGINFALYESNTNSEGKRIGANGWFNPTTSTVYIDIFSGEGLEQAMLRTASHELTHFIKAQSESQYESLKDYIVDKLLSNGNTDTLDSLIAREIAKAENRNYDMTRDEAIEEIVANSCEDMLNNADYIKELATNNKSLWNSIKNFINQFIAKIKKAFEGVTPNSAAYKELNKMLDSWNEIRDMWYGALDSGVVNYNNGEIGVSQKPVTPNFNMAEVNRMLNEYDGDNNKFPVDKKSYNEFLKYLNEKGNTNTENAIKHSDREENLEEYKQIATKAEKYFGTTSKFNLAGYLTVNGKMLDFSDGQRMRVRDHREIEEILDMPDDAGYSDSLIEFMNEGNIRLQSYGIDISVAPNENQIPVLKRFATNLNGEMTVDFSNEAGDNVGSIDYPEGTRSDRIIRDINKFFETGEVPVLSVTEQYHYSDREDSETSRGILANALMSTAITEREKTTLSAYQKLVGEINGKSSQLDATRQEIHDISFNKGTDRTKLKSLQAKADSLAQYIDRQDAKLLTLQATKPIQDLLKREKIKAEKRIKSKNKQALEAQKQKLIDRTNRLVSAAKERGKENLKGYKLREENRSKINSILKTSREMTQKLLSPTDDKHFPEIMKKPVLELLNEINLLSDRANPESANSQKLIERMKNVENMFNKMQNSSDAENYASILMELDPDFMSTLTDFTEAHKNGFRLDQLTTTELDEVHKMLKALNALSNNINKMYRNARFESVSDIADATINVLSKKRDKYKNGKQNKLLRMPDGLLNMDMLDAYSYFNQFGEGGDSVYLELRDGLNRRTNMISEAQDFTAAILDNINKQKLRNWTGSNATKHTFKSATNAEFTLTVGQMMNLYALSKREQALNHILSERGGRGIKASPIKGKGINNTVQLRNYSINQSILDEIINSLTDEQKNIVDQMQEYLSSKVAEWGNETSMEMYGYKKFGESNYWPIKSDSNSVATTDKTENNASLYAIRNQGMTKAINRHANNALVLDDVFDTYTNHIVNMANYNAYAVALTDAMKWYNYSVSDSESSTTDTVKQNIERVYGSSAKQYFTNLMKTINGDNGIMNMSSDVASKMMSNAKIAAVGANLRVVIQQPTAIMRAMAVMDPKYLVKAVGSKLAVKEAQKYSAIAKWKSWGYFETGIGQSMKSVITGQSTLKETISDKTTKLAGLADDITWGCIWNACKAEIKDTNPNLEVGTKEYFKAVSDRFDEVIDRTQVVDSVLHRAQIMKSKGISQLATAFMSEPIKTYNLMRNSILNMVENGASKESISRVARTTGAVLASVIVNAAASAFIDGLRGGDDDKDYWETYLESLKSNAISGINPMNYIPYVKELGAFIDSLMNYGTIFEPTRMDTQGLYDLFNGTYTALKFMQSNDYRSSHTPYAFIKPVTKGLSELTGIPAYSLTRELISVYNKLSDNPLSTTIETNTGKQIAAYFDKGDYDGGLDKMDELIEKKKTEILDNYPSYSESKAQSQAEASVKSSLSSHYKNAYLNGTESEKEEIKNVLDKTGLYDSENKDINDTLLGWEVSDLKEQYKKATTSKERTDIRKKLWNTGNWKSLKDLDEMLKKLINK